MGKEAIPMGKGRPRWGRVSAMPFVTSEANGGNVTYVVDEGAGASAVPVVIHKTP
jgi:hypothetical protein